jgi:hypothetical protein
MATGAPTGKSKTGEPAPHALTFIEEGLPSRAKFVMFDWTEMLSYFAACSADCPAGVD